MERREKVFACIAGLVRQETDAILICDLSHEILYMNPAAVQRYQKFGGEALLGKNVLDCHNAHSRELMQQIVALFERDRNENSVYMGYRPKREEDVYMVALRDADGILIGYYEKHCIRTRDTGIPYAQLQADR